MQVIWNTQNNEKLYAINESALYKQIQKKGRSVEHSLFFVEMIMIIVNLGVGIFLIIDGILDGDELYKFTFPALYFVFSLIAVFRRRFRKRQEINFEPTMIGELDKALWKVNYLMRQGAQITLWYLLPLMIAVLIITIIDDRPLTGLLFTIVLLPATYFATQWEMRKFHQPKKDELESLKELLLTEPTVDAMEG